MLIIRCFSHVLIIKFHYRFGTYIVIPFNDIINSKKGLCDKLGIITKIFHIFNEFFFVSLANTFSLIRLLLI